MLFFWAKIKKFKIYIYLCISTHLTTPKPKGPRKIFYTEYGACNAQSKRTSITHLNWMWNNSENGCRPRRKPSTRKKIQTISLVICYINVNAWAGCMRLEKSSGTMENGDRFWSCKGDSGVRTVLWNSSSQEERLGKCGGLIISDCESLILQRNTAVACNSEHWNLISLFWSQGIHLCLLQLEM